LQLVKLRRLQFGRSSKKAAVEIEQLELLIEELEVAGAMAEAEVVSEAVPAVRERRPGRRPLPEHLPRESLVHTAECSCPSCRGTLRPIGESISEMLEYRCETIVQAPASARPIARGLADPGLLAHGLVSKYADHLPLYRQAEIYARERRGGRALGAGRLGRPELPAAAPAR
jgi:hypothetical protein